MRRKPQPDNRPDWRDPDMPCYEVSKSRGMITMTPEEKQDLSRRRLQYQPMHYKVDPTYNLRKMK